MAMVLDAFASYVQSMLTEMVTEEVHMLLGVTDEIDKMDVKLRDLKNFLADADRRNITDTSVQEWVAQLKRAMYEAADILDLCQLKAMEEGPSTVYVGCFNPLLFCLDVECFNPLLFCMRSPSHAHEIGTRIKALNQNLDDIKERSAAFSFIPLGSFEDRSSKVQASCSGNCLNGSKLKVAVDGSEIGEYIIGDEGYPLLAWLLTPYQEEDLSDAKVEFNRRHSAATTCVLKAMARFKGTWKYLQEETWWPVNPSTIVMIIRACCMLHNIVIDMEDDAAMPRPETEDWNYCEEVRQLENEDAVRARDMLSQYFLTTMSSKSGVDPVDAEEDDENKEQEAETITAEDDENKEQEAETTAAEEERQC